MASLISAVMMVLEGAGALTSGGLSGFILWVVTRIAWIALGILATKLGWRLGVVAAVAWWGLSKLSGVSDEKMMKAPGKDYFIPRKDFERDPAAWFRKHRS